MNDDPSFGHWLQHRRKALDLTQAELGQRVGCAPDTIRKLEADVRRPSKEVAERLAECLAIVAEERPAFVRFARGESSTIRPTPVVPAPVPVRSAAAVQPLPDIATLTATSPDDTGIAAAQSAEPLIIAQQVDRNRSRMLKKVRDFWVDGVLGHAMQEHVLLVPGLEHQPHAVAHPWSMVVQHPAQEPRLVPAQVRITTVFDDVGGELLILGAPGAGKTTVLLELARELLDRAEQDTALE